jgi:hypothetical protein
MADGWNNLGAAFGGSSEKSYQEGLLTGAQTENALAQAAERVAKNKAQMQLADQLEAAGVPRTVAEASSGALTAGGNFGDVVGMRNKNQEYDFRARAGDPNVPIGDANRAMLAVSSGPSEPLYRVGNGYSNKFDNAPAITPLGDAVGGGGDAAQIQVLRAYGLLGPDGKVIPGQEERAFDVMRSTQSNMVAGGVPGTTTANPFSASRGVLRPATDAATVGANAAEVARATEVGKGTGEAQLGLEDALADINKLRTNVNNFLAAPGFKSVYGNVQGQPGVRGVLGVADQDIADAQASLKNLDAQTFGIAIQKMRGLGQLSNAEGMKVTDAFTRATNPTISETEAGVAWNDVLDGLDLAEARAKRRARPLAPASPAPAAAAAPGGPVSLDDYLKSKGF